MRCGQWSTSTTAAHCCIRRCTGVTIWIHGFFSVPKLFLALPYVSKIYLSSPPLLTVDFWAEVSPCPADTYGFSHLPPVCETPVTQLIKQPDAQMKFYALAEEVCSQTLYLTPSFIIFEGNITDMMPSWLYWQTLYFPNTWCWITRNLLPSYSGYYSKLWPLKKKKDFFNFFFF